MLLLDPRAEQAAGGLGPGVRRGWGRGGAPDAATSANLSRIRHLLHYRHLHHPVQRVVDVEDVLMVISVSQPEQTREAATMPPAHMSYLAIAADIADRIKTGEYPPGTRLPSYAQLADLYSVSVATVTRAVAKLRRDGLVQGYQGKGIFVTSVT